MLRRHSQAVEVRRGAKSEGGKMLPAESYQMSFLTVAPEK